MSDVFTKFMPSLDAIVEFHKANFEALVQAQTAWVKGSQEISKEIVSQAQSHLEAVAFASKSALTAKSIKDVVAFNVDGAKASYDKLVAGSTKLGELSVQVANDAFAPITARATAATESLMKPVAA